jgi:hypothetical protein
MGLSSWLPNRQRSETAIKRATFRPRFEALEDRWMPSTLTVTSIADSGAGSLRADIAVAQTGDTIVFSPSLNGQTITLTSGELLVSKNLTITGPGAGNLTISGNNASRVLEVAKPSKKVTPSVALSGLTICNGSAADGGGILVNSGTALAVTNSTLTSNTATSVSGGGGAIENYGTLTIGESILTGNTCPHDSGGGIYNEGMMTVTDCTLSSNSAWWGGAMAIMNTATVITSNITNNSARIGGGVYAFGNVSITITGCTLTSNTANVSVGEGGGIYAHCHSLIVDDCILSGNAAYDGGGFFIDDVGTVTLTNDTVQSNTATDLGGGLYIAPPPPPPSPNKGATVYLDTFTVDNTLNNTDSSGLNGSTANIDGSYTLN